MCGGGTKEIEERLAELETLINQINNKVESITKESLGLGNVDNTHDADKNVNSANYMNNITIPANSDLNTYISLGQYSCSSNGHAETILNCPTRAAFGMVVSANTPITQEITEYVTDNPRKWFRNFYGYGNTWSPWYRIYTEADPQPNLS